MRCELQKVVEILDTFPESISTEDMMVLYEKFELLRLRRQFGPILQSLDNKMAYVNRRVMLVMSDEDSKVKISIIENVDIGNINRIISSMKISSDELDSIKMLAGDENETKT